MFSKVALLSAVVSAGCSPSENPVTDDPPGKFLVAQGVIRHFPFAFDVPGGTLVSYSQHVDAVVPAPVDAVTLLGGSTAAAANFYLTGVVAAQGVLLGMSYITGALDPTSERSYGWTSQDGGVHWAQRLGVVQLPELPKEREAGWGGLVFHRRLHAIDGAIQGTLYGNFKSDGDWYRSVVGALLRHGRQLASSQHDSQRAKQEQKVMVSRSPPSVRTGPSWL